MAKGEKIEGVLWGGGENGGALATRPKGGVHLRGANGKLNAVQFARAPRV